MARANRYDTHRLDAVEVTPSGALRVPARLARVGVLTYRDAEGNSWGELVPPETLFDSASMSSARGVALVDLHPGGGLITPTTRKEHAVGHVGDDVQRDGAYLAAPVYVTDAAEIALVQSGDRKDTSCAYSCDFRETPGVFDGVPYQRVQIERRYNHVGLGPEGWGRAGTDVALRLDGAAETVGRFDAPVARLDSQTVQTTGAREAPPKGSTMKIIKIKGREYRLDLDTEMAEAQKKVDEVEGEAAKAPDLAASLDTAQKALMDAMATIARMKAELALAQAAKPEVVEADVPEAIADSIVSKRLKSLDGVRETARKVLPATMKLDGLVTAAAIHAAVVKHFMPEVKVDGGADALDVRVVEGMYAAIVGAHTKQAAKRADGDKKLAEVLAPSQEQADEVARQDAAAEADDPVAQQRAALKKWGSAPLGTKPVTAGKA